MPQLRFFNGGREFLRTESLQFSDLMKTLHYTRSNTHRSCGTGQVSLEVMIALTIFVSVVGAAIIVVFGGQSLSVETRESQRAVNFARQNLEEAIVSGKADFAALLSTSSVQGEFTSELTVSNIDSNTKEVVSRVGWQTNPLRPQKVELKTLVTNWQSVLGGGPVSGDWKTPRTLSSIDLGPGNAGTGVRVKGDIVYMSSIASDSKKPDIFVINAANPGSPAIIASTSTGPGANTLDLEGNYLYLANRSGDAELQIIDVTNPSYPFVARSFDILNLTGGRFGNSIFVKNDLLYMGVDNNTAGPEFYVINIADPLNPSVVGSLEVGSTINSVKVIGDRAFIAISSSTELWSINVATSAAPAFLDRYNATGTTEYGKSIGYIPGSASPVLYLGRLTGANHELYNLDTRDPAAIKRLGSIDVSGDVNAIVVRDYLMFVATNDANSEFKIYNISDSSNINLWSSFNFPQDATDIDYAGNLVFVSVRSNDALRIITSAP